MKHTIISLITIVFFCIEVNSANAQYVEPEEKEKITTLYPDAVFDSLQAKSALARGTGQIKGVAYTKPKTKLGYKAPLANKIKANKMLIQLFPVTPYLESWLAMRKKRENLKKRIYVYLSDDAYKYRLEAITNSEGRFTFPNMKPGKYFLTAILDYSMGGTYDAYTGSGYNNYGGRTDYYEKRQYTTNHSDRLERFVEVKEDGQVIEIKLN